MRGQGYRRVSISRRETVAARIDRRRVFTYSAALAGGVALGSGGLTAQLTLAGGPPADSTNAPGPYGPLSAKKAENDPGEWLLLPEGFKYTVFGIAGTPMSDGKPTPIAHDGMGAFRMKNNHVRLIRNHEVANSAATVQLRGVPNMAYDTKGSGGTTSLEIDLKTHLPVKSF